MKSIKMLGLAAVAAAALMAFAGASSASATVLCKTKPIEGGGIPGTTCPEGWAYAAGTVNHAVNVGVVKLETSFKTLECKKSTITGEFSNEGSATETVSGPINTLTLEECNCEIKVLKPGTQEVHWVPETSNSIITGNGAELTASCNTIFGTEHCIYVTSNSELGESTGGATAENAAILDVNVEIPRLPTSGACAEKAIWIATYETTEPKPLWFASHT